VPWLIVTLKDDKQESAEDEAKKNVSYKEVEAAMFAEQNGKTSADVVQDIQQGRLRGIRKDDGWYVEVTE